MTCTGESTSHSICFKWPTAKPTTFSEIDGYNVKYRIIGTKKFSNRQIDDPFQLSTLLEGLKSDSEYEIKVYGCNDGDEKLFFTNTVRTDTSMAKSLKLLSEENDKKGENMKTSNIEPEDIIDLGENVRCCNMISDYDEDEHEEKTIMLLGETGSGKSTMIDAMFNYMAGVSVVDDFRLKLVHLTDEEKIKSGKQEFGIMEHQVPKRPFRVTDSLRRGRKGIAASSYENIMQQCADRFQFTGPLSLFVEEDGTEIDEDFFELLPSNTVLLVIKAGEDWNPVPSTSQSAEPYLNNESQRVTDMVCKIRKAEVGSIKRTVSQNVTTYIGWLHYCHLNAKYIMVKNTKKQQNVGPRPVVLSRNIGDEQLMALLKKTFFTRGRSVKGMATNMTFTFGNVKGVEIAEISDVLSNPKPHIYLLSKEKIPDMAVYSSDSDELMDPQMTSAPAYTSQYTSPIMHGASSSLGTPNFTLSTICNTPCNTPVLSRQGTSHWNESGTPEVCLNSRNKCCVCYDMDINAFLVPCAHKFCFPCATRVKTTGQPCPICRTDITNVGSLVSSDM